ncbi:hypothetical protein MNBD_GAMMA11-3266 [hydrothermal vent metagenome]|uniref:Immunity MXAN-0049 protein domain-containing protein n=1 Tax=hydrothermal vent metagenome TaxID=652676 RepID=A0A3B0XJI9_9ZZZZ
MLQAEYYVLMRENNDNYPLFSWDQRRGDYCQGKPAEFKDSIKMLLGDPLSPNFEYVDFHKAPEFFISPRVAEVLAPLEIYGIQLVPAEVRNPLDPFSEIKKYCFLHIWNRIHCLDEENSEMQMNRAKTRIFSIDKLELDEKVLSMFELRKRLIFELSERTSVVLFHQTIKETIMNLNPKGFRFVPATDWYSDIVFS